MRKFYIFASAFDKLGRQNKIVPAAYGFFEKSSLDQHWGYGAYQEAQIMVAEAIIRILESPELEENEVVEIVIPNEVGIYLNHVWEWHRNGTLPSKLNAAIWKKFHALLLMHSPILRKPSASEEKQMSGISDFVRRDVQRITTDAHAINKARFRESGVFEIDQDGVW